MFISPSYRYILVGQHMLYNLFLAGVKILDDSINWQSTSLSDSFTQVNFIRK